jgi:hypothetical protein
MGRIMGTHRHQIVIYRNPSSWTDRLQLVYPFTKIRLANRLEPHNLGFRYLSFVSTRTHIRYNLQQSTAPLPASKTSYHRALQLGLPIPLRIPNPNNRLAPSPPLLQIVQSLSDLFEPIVHLVKDGRDEFPLAEQSHQFSPDVELLAGFVLCRRHRHKIVSVHSR